eukprot:scaffold6362_cov378-Prasinococcus_capsulatus_cf.AAC.16
MAWVAGGGTRGKAALEEEFVGRLAEAEAQLRAEAAEALALQLKEQELARAQALCDQEVRMAQDKQVRPQLRVLCLRALSLSSSPWRATADVFCGTLAALVGLRESLSVSHDEAMRALEVSLHSARERALSEQQALAEAHCAEALKVQAEQLTASAAEDKAKALAEAAALLNREAATLQEQALADQAERLRADAEKMQKEQLAVQSTELRGEFEETLASSLALQRDELSAQAASDKAKAVHETSLILKEQFAGELAAQLAKKVRPIEQGLS